MSRPGPSEDRFARARDGLAEELGRKGIRDRRVLSAIRRVPRHAFCEPGDEARAYADGVLPLPDGATLSQPFVVAAMLAALKLRGGERVLDVGSGSGYTTALLCELAGSVYAVEYQPALAAAAEGRLRALGYENFRMRAGNGWEGWLEHFPYQGILVSAAAPSVPPALLDQLAPGGRLVLPVGGEHQKLRVFTADESGMAFTVRDLFSVRFVPLQRDGTGPL